MFICSVFSHIRPKLNSDGTVGKNVYNVKRFRCFNYKLSFDGIIILEELPNIIIMIDVTLIAFQQGIIDLFFLIVCDGFPFHNKKNNQQHVSRECKGLGTCLYC